MFSVSFDDINWDPSAAAPSQDEPPAEIDFGSEFDTFIDSDFSFPEDDFGGESRSKRTRTEEETKGPFFKSPFKQSLSKTSSSSTSNPFDLDDLLGVSEIDMNTTNQEAKGGSISSTEDFYDSETTSEGGYSCEDPLLDEIESWYPKKSEKSSSKLTIPSREWSDFDFSTNTLFDIESHSIHSTRGACGKLKKKSSTNEHKKRHRKANSDAQTEENTSSSTTSSTRRRRRKVDMEQLRSRISNLIERKSSSDEIPVNDREELAVREAIISTFFHYRATNMSDKNRWLDLVSDDFTMMLPRTIYRSQPEEGLGSTSSSTTTTAASDDADSSTNLLSNLISDVRTVFGIEALVSDTSSIHGMVEVIRSRVRAQRPELARKRAAGFALNLLLDENSLKCDENSGAFKATWHMSTHGLVSAGFSSECAVDGIARMRFDSSYKLVTLELEFDALSFGRQLQRHKLLDPTQLARQNASVLGAISASPVGVAGGKIAIGTRGAGGVLAPAPLGARPSVAFMKSFGQACAAVKQASEAVAVANGTQPTNSPPSAQRVMQLMALNLQLMQAGGAGGVLLPGGSNAAGGATTASAKKGKTSPSLEASADTSTPSTTTTTPSTASTTTPLNTTSSVPPVPPCNVVAAASNKGKKRSAPVNVTEVGTASAESLDIFGLARQLTNNAVNPTPLASATPLQQQTNKTEVRTTINTTPPPPQVPVLKQQQSGQQFNQIQQALPLPQPTQNNLLPTSHMQHLRQHMSMPPMQFQPMNVSQMPPALGSNDQLRNFPLSGMPPPPQPTSNNQGANIFTPPTPSSDSILSLFPYGLPSTNQLTNNAPPPPPLSAAQLSQMFGLLQSNNMAAAGPHNGSNNTNPPFLGFLPQPSQMNGANSFPGLGSLDQLPPFCPPPFQNLSRP